VLFNLVWTAWIACLHNSDPCVRENCNIGLGGGNVRRNMDKSQCSPVFSWSPGWLHCRRFTFDPLRYGFIYPVRHAGRIGSSSEASCRKLALITLGWQQKEWKVPRESKNHKMRTGAWSYWSLIFSFQQNTRNEGTFVPCAPRYICETLDSVKLNLVMLTGTQYVPGPPVPPIPVGASRV